MIIQMSPPVFSRTYFHVNLPRIVPLMQHELHTVLQVALGDLNIYAPRQFSQFASFIA